MNLFSGIQLDFFEAPKEYLKKRLPNTFHEGSLVVIKYSSRLKKSIRCSKNGFFGRAELTLPAFMQEEAFAQSRALATAWAECAIRRKTKKNREKIKDLLERFWQSVDQTLVNLGEKRLSMRGRLPPIVPKGETHDLGQIFDAVNETYFKGELRCKITWSNRIGGQSFHSIRKDSFTGEDIHLISISKGYDMPNCPMYAVMGVVYHECLHVMIPPEVRSGRRVVHGSVFRKHERRYIYYDEWIKWHREVLPQNIRAIRLQKKRTKK